MENNIQDLKLLSEELKKVSLFLEDKKFKNPLTKLTDAASDIAVSWSGSFLGYHSRTYYFDFKQPPPQAIFNRKLGINNSHGDWCIYTSDAVINEIYDRAGNPSLEYQESVAKSAESLFEKSKKAVKSILSNIFEIKRDNFLESEEKELNELKILYAQDFAENCIPKHNISSDYHALNEGLQFPPHIQITSQVYGITSAVQSCKDLNDIIESLISHLSRSSLQRKNQNPLDKKRIFIGHGNSRIWLELKICLTELGLELDEFNRIPTAGISIKERLEQMLDTASFAFLIMTAEDEKKDGSKIARMNVIHEIGLFQGRLGFEKAIILLEEDCEEFSNIHGLGQLRFPKGHIGRIFEDIRKILKKENILNTV
ncbi:MAG: nucleotide-binding protein [Ignavibacteria bacterium]|nr:nucleotide-binding protein [Ignavibacteria bacterium]